MSIFKAVPVWFYELNNKYILLVSSVKSFKDPYLYWNTSTLLFEDQALVNL